jgi:hypothetical protein
MAPLSHTAFILANKIKATATGAGRHIYDRRYRTELGSAGDAGGPWPLRSPDWCAHLSRKYQAVMGECDS